MNSFLLKFQSEGMSSINYMLLHSNQIHKQMYTQLLAFEKDSCTNVRESKWITILSTKGNESQLVKLIMLHDTYIDV